MSKQELEVPEGWKRVILREVLTESKIPTINDDISKRLTVKLHLEGVVKRDERDSDQVGKTRYYIRRAGQFIYGKQNLHNGAIGIIPIALDGYLSSLDLPAFDVNGSPKYIYYYFARPYFYKRLEFLAKGTGSKRVYPRDLLNSLFILLPPLPEQEKIAEILSTIDNAIDKTDKIIEKYKRIKQGLMQELLTKGIDKNFRIRNEQTHKFKDSPLGRIPEEWEVVRLGDEELFNLETGGTPSTDVEQYWHGNILWMSSGEVHKKKIFDTDKKISEIGYRHSNAKYIPKYSILIALAGQGKTRGTVAINYVELTTNQSVAAIIPNKERVYFLFVFYRLEYDYGKLRSISLGSGRAGLSLRILKEYQILLPPLPEQERIASILSQIDEVIEKEQKYKAKLERIKQGLMNDLLTGKVRVNKLIERYENVQKAR